MTAGRARSSTAWLSLAGAVLVAAAVVAISAWAGSWPYRTLGIGDPGTLVRYGAPLLRLLADAAATVCVGSLAFAVCFTRPDEFGRLAGGAYAAVLSAGRWALVWAVAAGALVQFELADLSGVPLSGPAASASGNSSPAALWATLEQPLAWLITGCCAVVVALGCRVVLRWRTTVAMLGLAVLALLPVCVTGHSASQTGHDLATGAILIHVPVAVIWIGVLIALLRPRLRADLRAPDLSRRYRRLALGCWLTLAVSGVVVAAVLVPLNHLFDSQYGQLLAIKILLVVGLGVIGVLLRRSAFPGSTGMGSAAMARLVASELTLLSATFAVSVGLTHVAPPSFGGPVSADESLLGYDLRDAPTLWRVVFDWRIEVLFAALSLLLACAYLAGVWRLRRRAQPWPAGRTAAWLAGCALLVVATGSGIGRYAPAMFSFHIISHMLTAMVAPILLALGGPLTLARSALSPARPGAPLGPVEWIELLTDSPVTRFLTHPLVALSLVCGAPFVLYLGGLFDLAARFHWAHELIGLVFLLMGYLFAWCAVGTDPLPHPLPTLARLGLLLAAMPFGIVFGAALMGTGTVIGNGTSSANMYSALALPWVSDLHADQHTGAVVALVIGEAALLIAVAVLLWRWQRTDLTGDGEDMDSYQAVLTALHAREHR